MNRRQKIIVSVVGIFIILLALVGLTYAYFLTQITGNTEDTSITVTTANLELVYGDGNGVLTPAQTIVPGNPIKFKKTDGTVVNEKTFTVTNTGDDTDYVVIIDGDNNLENGITPINVTYATNSGTEVAGATTTFESNDFRYTITCMNGTEECNGVTNEVFPLNGGIVVGNKISSNEVHTYTLTMEYIETDVNQSEDMNKTFSAVLNIEDIRRINPYSDNTDSLAYNIINNSINGSNGTKLLSSPITLLNEPAQIPKKYVYSEEDWTYSDAEGLYKDCWGKTVTTCDESMIGKIIGTNCGNYETEPIIIITGCDISGKPIVEEYSRVEREYEKTLSITQDKYGTSYYYRGAVEDNYLNFAGMCWRVVRIQGDGSIKLILDDKNAECNDTTENDKNADNIVYTGDWSLGNKPFDLNEIVSQLDYKQNKSINYEETSGGYETLPQFLYEFQRDFSSVELSKLKSRDWCLNEYSYEINSFKCNGYLLDNFAEGKTGNIYPMYVGLINAYEGILAGGTNSTKKAVNAWYDYYGNYLIEGGKFFYTLDMYKNNSGNGVYSWLTVYNNNGIYAANTHTSNIRPSVVLAKNTTITGVGTKLDPYVVQ